MKINHVVVKDVRLLLGSIMQFNTTHTFANQTYPTKKRAVSPGSRRGEKTDECGN